MEIENTTDFRRWVKMQLASRELSQRQLAVKMGVSYPRISEALHGKPSGRKCLIPIIKELGGDVEKFQNVL